ncbi:hypothetical protein PUN4_280241 [Paraburkholderia unamae]|nr:hypothetical protein PUN4_280241 [Paraburkholderia unamae]
MKHRTGCDARLMESGGRHGARGGPREPLCSGKLIASRSPAGSRSRR